MKRVNSAGIKREHILGLMMEDGFGPDEVIAHAKEYASSITGTRPSRTAILRVERIARGIIRDTKTGELK
ncbi:hypothetical protein LCGC14_1857160 [marine sediment metagenome]|uniref:Uncharacterized protein n=1 Tax=marine sediment metagenome TaxID=412755 RepID=A0A0F9G8Z3_9ZZZZ